MLNGLLDGQSNAEMSRTHDLGEVTIKHHLKNHRSKLGAKIEPMQCAGLLNWALRAGHNPQ